MPRLLCAAAFSLISLTSLGHAQSFAEQKIADPGALHPIILTVSGGISRGSYQGGLNWGLVEIARRSTIDDAFYGWLRQQGVSRAPRLYIAAAGGASAGNINSLLSAIEWCGDGAAREPEASLFWKAWVWTGWPQLMMNKDTLRFDEHGIFDRVFFDTVLRKNISDNIAQTTFRPGCSVPVGITTTRLLPDTITVSADIQASSQRVAVPFRVVTDGAGRMTFVHPERWVLRDPPMGEIVVFHAAQGGGGRIGFDTVFRAVEASSAFPLAFAPRTLRYNKGADVFDARWCAPAAPAWTCGKFREAQFLDGGVFDNNPLGVAFALYRCSTLDLETPDMRFSEQRAKQPTVAPQLHCPAPARPSTLIYMDPDARRDSIGRPTRVRLDSTHQPGLAPLAKLISGAVQTGRQYELAMFSRTAKLLPNAESLHLVATNRYQAIVGDHFNAFGAFLGRPFREYDFYAGIYDAFYFTANEWLCRAPHDDTSPTLAAPDSATLACISRFIESATCDGQFRLEAPARAVIAQLHRQEFRRELRCSSTAKAEAPQLVAVLEAVGRGNERIREIATDETREKWLRVPPAGDTSSRDDRFGCRGLAFLDALLCAQGFRLLLDELESEEEMLEALAQAPACADSIYMLPYLTGCHVDETVLGLVSERIPTADELFRDLLRRLALVENDREREDLVDGLELAYYIGRTDDLRGRAWFSARIPNIGERRDRTVRVLPFQVTNLMGHKNVIAGYRPTWYSRYSVDLVFPLEFSNTVHYFRQPSGLYRSHTVNAFSAGAGFLFKGAYGFDYFQLNGFVSLRNSSRCYGADNIGGEISTALLFGHLRLGYRQLGWCDRGRHNGGAIVGLSDLNGLVYWLPRLLN